MSELEYRRHRRQWNARVRIALTQAALLVLAAVIIGAFATWTGGFTTAETPSVDVAVGAGTPLTPGLTASDKPRDLEHTRLRLERATEILKYASKYRIPADLSASIYDMAQAEGIHPSLGFQLVKVESGFRPHARSPRGAIGYTQMRLRTARGYDPDIDEARLAHRETNLRLGFRFLRDLLTRFDNNLPVALMAYNRGPTLVDSLITSGEDPSNGYSEAVMRGLKRSVRLSPQDVRRGS